MHVILIDMRLILLSALVAVRLGAQSSEYNGHGYVHTEVAPGVHTFVFDNPLGDAAGVDGTAVVIINDQDVIVVDAQWSPATARRVIAEIKRLTPNPVRYVINTHWHGDHWFGNQAYREAYPGVEFVSHPNTLLDMQSQEIAGFEKFRDQELPAYITDLEQRLSKGIRRDGKPYTASDSALVKKQIAAMKWATPVVKEVVPTFPTVMVAD